MGNMRSADDREPCMCEDEPGGRDGLGAAAELEAKLSVEQAGIADMSPPSELERRLMEAGSVLQSFPVLGEPLAPDEAATHVGASAAEELELAASYEWLEASGTPDIAQILSLMERYPGLKVTLSF